MAETTVLNDAPYVRELPESATLLGLNGSLSRFSSDSVFSNRPTVTDLNDATTTGYYTVNITRALVIKNNPPGVNYGILLVFEDGATPNQEFVQILFSISTPPGLYIRKKGTQSGWGSWYNATLSEIKSGGGGKSLCANVLRFSAERRWVA